MTLLERVTTVANDAIVAYGRDPAVPPAATARLAAARARLDEPLRVAFAGNAKAGKSTLLNALVGELLAPTGTTECTRIVTWYHEGLSYRATAELTNGDSAEVRLERDGLGIDFDLGALSPDDVSRIVVEWPSAALRSMTLIDTPGIGSLSDVGRRTVELLGAGEERASTADAVVYLTPHVHTDDVRFLEAFHDDGEAHATPVNAIAVLSRADEVGGARPDALTGAGRVATRYCQERSLRRLCQTVIPVAGLLAQGAATMIEAEFRAIAALATADEEDVDAMLLSAGRFAAADIPSLTALVPVADRALLVDRFGIFGIRLAIDLVRHAGVSTARSLGTELRHRSGIDELRTLLLDRFGARRDVLKARSSLLAIEDVLRRWPPGGEAESGLRAQVESVRATAHELAELRAMIAVRAGAVPLDEPSIAEVERLLSSAGDPAERLGLLPGDPGLRDAVVDAVGRWRGRAAHPLAPPAVIELSDVVVRTLEGFLPS